MRISTGGLCPPFFDERMIIMGSYIPSSKQERLEMLKSIGLSDFDGLYSSVPEEVKLKSLNLPNGKSELEVSRIMQAYSDENKAFKSIFRGAGAYNHYIPAIVKSVTSKEEFVTAYTPYQAEMSQGILQSIFEYQTAICELTGMDVSNACVYDGASAAAEAAAMCRDRKRNKVLVSSSTPPQVLSVIKTYCFGSGAEVVIVPTDKNGVTDIEALKSILDAQSACVYVQQPNFYGLIEDCEALAAVTHEGGAKFIMGCNPIALAVLKTPAECGADIAVGEGQPLGMPLSFGGPYLGFMASTKAMMRKLPGRIVGQTEDAQGRKAYVLTLQAREQHIRREKASSNICSNEALCAMTASVYLAAVGTKGLKEAAALCMSKARYLASELCKLPCFKMRYEGEYFHEFVTDYDGDASALEKKLCEKGILPGLPVDEGILWCCTEMNTKEDIDTLIEAVKEVESI